MYVFAVNRVTGTPVSLEPQETPSAGSPLGSPTGRRGPGTPSAGGPGLWRTRAKHQFSPPTHQQLQEGLTLFANPENYYFLSSKTLRGKKPASPRNPNPRGRRASENSHTENREGMIQRQPDLLKANTHHQLHFC